MKISQKRTCHSCRALTYAKDKWALVCGLGYTINGHCVPDFGYCNPTEPCPKPISKDDLQVAKLSMMKRVSEND